MMLQSFSYISRRLYHDSTGRQRLPVVKQSSARVGRAIKSKLDNQAQPRISDANPNRKFEPFPFAVTEENKLEVLRKKVTPLADIPYEEQLASKQSYCRNSLRYLAQQLYKLGTPVRLDVKRLPCPVNPIVAATQLEGYRNKDEFSIWRGHDGKTITVGFMAFPIGKHGDTVCIEPNGCTIMKDASIKMCDILQEFMTKHAQIGVSYSLGEDGGWRRFVVRSNDENELMLIGNANPRTLRVQEIIDERNRFRDFIVQKAVEADLKLKSLYFQPCPHNKCFHKDVPFELIYGQSTLSEIINGYEFKVSPESFMPESSQGAKLLIGAIQKVIQDNFPVNDPTSKPLIIDTNCGSGIVSLHLAELASRVVGIDRSGQAIADAHSNAKVNKIENIDFLNTELEIALERILEKHSKRDGDTLVICHPRKAGLHRHVVEALRKSSGVKKIIFVTSKADSDGTIDNLTQLCEKSSSKSSPPFTLISATPVDLYPLLTPCELIIALERMPE